MQKIKARMPTWDTTKHQSKKGWDKLWGWADKLGAPINRFSNRIGSEAFWPTTLDKESYKAARILQSFCKDGFYTEEEIPDPDGPKKKQRVLKKIPEDVIKNAVGLCIFTTMRTGLWVSGAGGSGVLVARKEDGSWSPPSGIMLHTAGLGFLVGVDIYDCVLVINNRKALESFQKLRCTLGGEISAVAGPVGVGGVLENDGKWKQANRPVFTYLKSRGFYAGVQVDGTIVIERSDENARFYGETIGVADILAGKTRYSPPELKMLFETLKAAEGSADVDEKLLEELDNILAPGDVPLEAPGSKYWGIPDPDDPDPFGAIALEKEGLEIREAGTRSRPSSEQFEFRPSPNSPVHAIYSRASLDSARTRERSGSYTTTETVIHVDETPTPATSPTTDRQGLGIVKEDAWGNEEENVWALQREVPKLDNPHTHPNRRVPPPLPPRQQVVRLDSAFEDIDLDKVKTNDSTGLAVLTPEDEVDKKLGEKSRINGVVMGEKRDDGLERSASSGSSEYHSPELVGRDEPRVPGRFE